MPNFVSPPDYLFFFKEIPEVFFHDTLLGIGDKLHAFALVPLGYPAEDRPQQDRYDEKRIHYID